MDRYDFCKKHAWANWIDTNIIYYIYDKPKTCYRTIKHWFYCNFNKEHWNLLKQAFNSYGWDYSFLLQLEEAQIDKQIKWFKNHQIMIDEQYEQICRTLKWAKHCLHIINNEDVLYHFEGESVWKDNKDGTSELIKTADKIYDGPKVNWRNASRFFNEDRLKNPHIKDMPKDLYIAKCINLYYNIRKNYTEYWWD